MWSTLHSCCAWMCDIVVLLIDSFRILVCVATATASFLVVSFSSTVWMSILGNAYIWCLCVFFVSLILILCWVMCYRLCPQVWSLPVWVQDWASSPSSPSPSISAGTTPLTRVTLHRTNAKFLFHTKLYDLALGMHRLFELSKMEQLFW